MFLFKLVAVKTISWAYDDELPKETSRSSTAACRCTTRRRTPTAAWDTVIPGGWNRVKNVSDQKTLPAIT